MPKPNEIIDMVASLQNDTAQTVYTDAAVLPYFNMALRDLQEEFELNNIPVTNEVSSSLNVPLNTTVIAFTSTTPTLPSNLIEIQRVWESDEGQNVWTPMFKREFIPHYIEGVNVTKFGIWAWMDNEIHLPSSIQDNDLKLDYTKSIFSTIAIAAIDTEMGIKFQNVFSYLGYRTAALCSLFIGENETRAMALQGEAGQALYKSMGISVKGKQSIMVRRRPFRASYKGR